jgi:hypothetical protein
MHGQAAPRAPDGLSDTPGPFGKIIFILNGPGVPVSLTWRQMVVDKDAEAISGDGCSTYDPAQVLTGSSWRCHPADRASNRSVSVLAASESGCLLTVDNR